ncbi:hypothetical protein ACOMHN_031092 [Nucella lapillus]
MASALLTASLRSRCNLFYCFFLLVFLQYSTCYIPDKIKVKCRDTIDLRGMNLQSGLVVSELPEKIPIYPHEDQRCDIFLSFSEGNEMMFYFDYLDLYSSDRSKCDSTNVEFFDGSASTAVKGLEEPICGRQEEMPTGVYYVLHNLLIIRANSNGVVQGAGFTIHFTIYRRGFPCDRDEFSCESYDAHTGSQGFRRCVDSQLVCDDWNDCGDWADERQNCNDLTTGAIAAIVLVALALVALVVGLIFFCWLRRRCEIRRLGEKEASAVMRDTSFASSRVGGPMMSPFSISNETLEKDGRYIPRYAAGRNSARSSSSRAGGPPAQARGGGGLPDYQEHPPPYSETPTAILDDDSRSSNNLDQADDRPRSRGGKRREREPDPDEVFVGEEDVPRVRRGRSRSQDERAPPREDRNPPRDDQQPARRDDRDSPRSDRYPRDRGDDRRPPRDDRYPSGRDNSPPGRRDDRDRDRYRPLGRHDDRDRTPNRYDDRDRPRYDDRDRPPSRHDQRDRERDRDRPRPRHDNGDRERGDPPRRERPTSQRGPPEDRYSSGPEDDKMDQLHPLRDLKRRSMHTDSDPDVSKEEGRPPQDRSPNDDRWDDRERRPRDSNHRRPPPKEDHDLQPPPRGREDRSSPRGSDREDRPPPPRDRDERPRDRSTRGPSRDDRPDRPRNDRPRDEPRSQHRPKSRTPDDSYEDVEFRGHPSRKDSPPPGDDPSDSPSRNRRRRSRSRDGQDRDGRGGRGRGGGRRGESLWYRTGVIWSRACERSNS